MPRLIRVFAERTDNFVGFVVPLLKFCVLASQNLRWYFSYALFFKVVNQYFRLVTGYTPGVDFTKGFKTWYKFSTEIRFMLIPIIVLFVAHEFITGKF